MKSFSNPVKFRDQDFKSLLKECLKSRVLFSDPTFPADQKSIGMPELDLDPKKAIKWLRPKEITKNAVFVEDTIGTTDICQGQLGNCWLLAALSCLTMHPTLFVKVVPSDQSLSDAYAGIFHFTFWQYGEWVEVVVDDRLPVREGRLLFSYSHTRNEFWSALVEKAYAKLIGSYGSLKGGNISEGMEDFTGGIAYSLPVSSRSPRVLWRVLTGALSRGSLLSCFIQATDNRDIGKVTAEGLVKGHAYAITESDKVTRGSDEVLLLRLRNPWGFVEYCGPWSDNPLLQKLHRCRPSISVEDFSNLYNVVELCSVSPDTLDGENTPVPESWTISEHKGSWVPGCSAGGSRKNNQTFWKNPQFKLVLREQDQTEEDEDEDENDDDDEDAVEGTTDNKKEVEKPKHKGKHCTVLVELLQKNRRQKDKLNFLYIAFHIYRLQGVCLDRNFFMKNRPVGRSGKYKALRGAYRRLRLDPGNYIIVASTFRPNQPGDFFVMAAPAVPEDQVRVQEIFNEVAGSVILDKDYHLQLETCRELIFGEDTNGRSRLSREQTETLLSSLRNLQSIFTQFDVDSSGTMSPFELSSALEALGMQCDSKVVQLLCERFTSGELQMPFHSFVSCFTRLRKLFAVFESETSQEVKDRGINAVRICPNMLFDVFIPIWI
uniref:Uncharacterized protein n=1 Tax=Anabas testudineus TaxID=64144 RepID=A0A3Q1IPK4_ANATE